MPKRRIDIIGERILKFRNISINNLGFMLSDHKTNHKNVAKFEVNLR